MLKKILVRAPHLEKDYENGSKVHYVEDQDLHKCSIVKGGNGRLADMEDSHEIKIPDDMCYYCKSQAVPPVIL